MIIIPKNKIYNSYIIESQDIEASYKIVSNFIESFNFSRPMIEENSHPDMTVISKDADKQSISVEMIRKKIIDKVDIKPSIADRRVFIIKVDTILSNDVQNVLLKTLEEPPAYVSIFILIKNRESLLDTVKSRCFYIRDDENKITIDDIKDNECIEDILRVVVNLKYNDVYDIIDLSKILCDVKNKKSVKSNDEFKKVIIYILYLTRDAFYYKKTYDKKNILLKDKEVQVISMADSYTYEAMGRLIDLLQESLEYIDSNVDKQLLIEDMLMKTKKLL